MCSLFGWSHTAYFNNRNCLDWFKFLESECEMKHLTNSTYIPSHIPHTTLIYHTTLISTHNTQIPHIYIHHTQLIYYIKHSHTYTNIIYHTQHSYTYMYTTHNTSYTTHNTHIPHTTLTYYTHVPTSSVL